MSVKLLAEHHLEFLSLKEGCTVSSESTLVKMPLYWKSHVMFYFSITHLDTETRTTDTPQSIATEVQKPDTWRSRSPLSSFKRTWNEWAGGTTLHGIKFIFDDGSSVVRR